MSPKRGRHRGERDRQRRRPRRREGEQQRRPAGERRGQRADDDRRPVRIELREDLRKQARGLTPPVRVMQLIPSELPFPASSASTCRAREPQPSACAPAGRTRLEIGMSAWHLVVAIALVGGLTGCARDTRPPVDDDTARIAAADAEPGNWLSHGRTYGEQRSARSRAYRQRTVTDLGLAWSYDLRDESRRRSDAARPGRCHVRHVCLEHRPRDRREDGPKAGCTIRKSVARSGRRRAAMSSTAASRSMAAGSSSA